MTYTETQTTQTIQTTHTQNKKKILNNNTQSKRCMDPHTHIHTQHTDSNTYQTGACHVPFLVCAVTVCVGFLFLCFWSAVFCVLFCVLVCVLFCVLFCVVSVCVCCFCLCDVTRWTWYTLYSFFIGCLSFLTGKACSLTKSRLNLT